MAPSDAPLYAVREGKKVRVRLGGPIEPVHKTLAARLRTAIERGALQPDDRLPGEEAMAEAFKISRDPVRRALRLLAEEGLVTGRQGAGWYVVDQKNSPS